MFDLTIERRGEPTGHADTCGVQKIKVVDKPDPVLVLKTSRNHLSRTFVAKCFVRPTQLLDGSPNTTVLFGLATDGVYTANAVTSIAVGSYPTISTLPVPEGHRRYIFCCTFRQLTLPGR